MADVHHYTDKNGYNSIRADPIWLFRAVQPPGGRPLGAYFTTLPPRTPNLAKRLRIPRSKLEYVFMFSGMEGLVPISGDRGEYILYSPDDYAVTGARQIFFGRSEDV